MNYFELVRHLSFYLKLNFRTREEKSQDISSKIRNPEQPSQTFSTLSIHPIIDETMARYTTKHEFLLRSNESISQDKQ